MALEIEAVSELGSRENQQDAYLYRPDDKQTIAVVCDGMGGLSGGGQASRTAVQQFKQDFAEEYPLEKIPAFLTSEVRRLDELVFTLTDDKGRRMRAGSTIASVVIEENRLYWMAVGDSEIFVLRREEMVSVNRKHNYQLQIDEMLQCGRISQEAYQQERRRGGQLISYLGLGNVSIWDVNEQPLLLQPGDIIGLCSDGITNTIPQEELGRIIRQSTSLAEAVKIISRKIQQQEAGQDNATIILLKYTR